MYMCVCVSLSTHLFEYNHGSYLGVTFVNFSGVAHGSIENNSEVKNTFTRVRKREFLEQQATTLQ